MTAATRTIAVWAESFIAGGWGPFIMGNTKSESGLPWAPISADLQHFRETTRNHILVMGRTTFDKLPASMKTVKSLQERPIVVVTHNPAIKSRLFGFDTIEVDPAPWMTEETTIANLVDTISLFSMGKPVAVIGGARVIETFAPAIDELIVTQIDPFIYPAYGDVGAPSGKWSHPFRSVGSETIANGVVVSRFTRAPKPIIQVEATA